MALQNNSSVMALMVETTEGTPVVPAAGTDYIAQQDGFDFDPSFDVLDNIELKSSIGKAQPILGKENPKVTLSHYMRASGVEGQAPDFAKLLKALFGSENINSTQRTTAAASTTTVLKLAAGGSDFARGRCVLVKDGTNGYAIRPVDSVATNDLTLGFALASAPAAGISCGKAITYAPVSVGHPSLTVWEFRANGGAVEAISGGRVTQMNMSVVAGQMINGAFTIEGVKYFFNPIQITSANNKLDFTDDDGTWAATIPPTMYRDPHELATAVTDAMNSANALKTHLCVYNNATGTFTITSTGTVLTLKFATGANTANTIATKLGFTVADRSGTGATTGYTGSAISLAAPQTPAYDAAAPLVGKDNEILLGTATDITSLSASKVDINVTNTKGDIDDITSSSGKSGSIIQTRQSVIQITAMLSQYDASKFKAFRANDQIKLLLNSGVKSGGNWVAGKCMSVYSPTCTVTKCKLTSVGGLVNLDLEVKPFVDSSGNGELYMNFL